MGRVLATAQEHPMKFSKAEIDAAIAASPRTTVPFNKLVLSPGYQARPAGTTSKLSVAELAASIKANDVPQPDRRQGRARHPRSLCRRAAARGTRVAG